MGKKLAIKGHLTRGLEVIEILEMMGGKNIEGYIGIDYDEFYTIEDGYIIQSYDWNDCLILSLEEFLEKYPFKVGDLKDLIDDHISCIITEMRWNVQDECMEYHAEFGPNDYGWYRVYDFCHDYQIEKSNTVISGINLNSCDYADEVELNLGDYEIEVRDGRTYAVKKKSKYPTTYEECWKVRFEVDGETTLEEFHHVSGYYSKSLGALQKLLCCRDAYWKIAGEEMRLDEPWNPNWKNTKNVKYGITLHDDIITKMYLRNENVILAFPTEEMRDAFYKNFKELIEECKELL